MQPSTRCGGRPIGGTHEHRSPAGRREFLGIKLHLELDILAGFIRRGSESNARRPRSTYLAQRTTRRHAHEELLDRRPRRTWILIDFLYRDVGIARLLQLARMTPVELLELPLALSNISCGGT